MSVLIKGMKMPKDCIDCRFHKSLYCTLTNICTNTAQRCPLVALPDKHGRLIDADALNLEYEVEMADDWKTAHEIANCVKYAPTIIEAVGKVERRTYE